MLRPEMTIREVLPLLHNRQQAEGWPSASGGVCEVSVAPPSKAA